MKQENFNEFDLNAIYAKLISPSKPMYVKACDFFAPKQSMLTAFQREMDEYFDKNLVPLRSVIVGN